jgi:glycosyltransferase involved in cell wall biosynthesis
MLSANQRIVISKVIQDLVRTKYNRDSVLIPNGVQIPKLTTTRFALEHYGLEHGRYVLQVSRFVPEKNQQDLIRAFAAADMTGWKLVLVGALDPPDDYVSKILSLAEKTPGVVLTGFQSGVSLQELYANAGIFVLPSSHEGLPVALLEALSYGLPTLASDIPGNIEVGLHREHYFPLGDTAALADKLCRFAALSFDAKTRSNLRSWARERYNWQSIAKRTLEVYRHICA